MEAVLERALPRPPTSIGRGSGVRARDGRVVGRVPGSTPLWLLVRSGWWFPVTRRVSMDLVEEANDREVRLRVSAEGFRDLPVYLPDEEIDRRVWRSLEATPSLRRLLAAGALTISVHDGVVTLSGNVPNRFYQRKLAELAGRIEGAVDVVDRLYNDLEVRRSVERALRRSLPGAQLRTSSWLGRLTLVGRSGSPAERERAVAVALSLPGVQSVISRIEVEVAPTAV